MLLVFCVTVFQRLAFKSVYIDRQADRFTVEYLNMLATFI